MKVALGFTLSADLMDAFTEKSLIFPQLFAYASSNTVIALLAALKRILDKQKSTESASLDVLVEL